MTSVTNTNGLMWSVGASFTTTFGPPMISPYSLTVSFGVSGSKEVSIGTSTMTSVTLTDSINVSVSPRTTTTINAIAMKG
jgi:hypothetical protein